jgi:hypothetical protein
MVLGPQNGEKFCDYPMFELCKTLLSQGEKEGMMAALQFSDDESIMSENRYIILTDVTGDFDQKTAQRPVRRRVYLLTEEGLEEFKKTIGINSQNLHKQ